MIKRLVSIGLVGLLLLAAPLACAQTLSFPYSGVQLAAQDDWTVLTPDSIASQADMLEKLGVELATLEADYAAGGTAFEVYLPEGGQVSLSAVQTEQTAAWRSTVYMTEAQKEQLFTSMDRAPYEHVAWSEDMPGWLTYDWALQAGGVPVSFAGLTTVRQGTLYTLTASGAEMDTVALHAANQQVLAQLTFLGTDIESSETAAVPAMPEAIEDNGAVTPIAMVDFSPVVYEDNTVLTIKTLPGAEIVLHTATDFLRGTADAEGRHRFQVSTKRETVYAYTISATAPERSESRLEVAVERRLTPEAQEDAYRKSARQVSVYGYTNLVASPEAFTGKPITFRGRVGGFTELGGFPCVLVYTENPGKGVWRTPIWVMLTEAISLQEDDIRTVYGDLRGDTLPYTDAAGEEQQAPVVVGRAVVE